MSATQTAASVQTLFSSYQNETDPTSQETRKTIFESKAIVYYENMQITIYLGFIALTFPLRILLTMAFAKKNQRGNFSFFNVANFLDIAIFVVFAIRMYLEYRYYYDSDVYNATSNDVKGTNYYDNVFRDTDYDEYLDYLYSIASACLWVRIIMLFRLTRFLGPLVKMIQNMMHDIFIFMILF